MESEQGHNAANIGKPYAAIRHVDTAIAEDPSDIRPGDYADRALAYQELDKNEAALRDLDEGIRRARLGTGLSGTEAYPVERVGELYEDRAIVYCKLGQYDRAIQDANTAISFADAISMMCRKSLPGKTAECQRAVAGIIAGYYDIRAYARGGQGHYDLALRDLQEAARRSPGDADNYYYQGLAYQRLGDPKRANAALEEAVSKFDKLIAADTAPASVYSCQQGVVLFALGKDNEGQQAFDRCYTSLKNGGSPEMIPRYEQMANAARSHPKWGPVYW